MVNQRLRLPFIAILFSVVIMQGAIPCDAAADDVHAYSQNAAGFDVQVVEIPRGAAQPQVVLGNDYVGGTEELSSMASRSGAIAAINGTFFEAYGDVAREPDNMLMMNHRVIHANSNGTTIGFTTDGHVIMDAVKVKIEGSTNHSYAWPNNWYAWGFNHTPQGNGIFIYTPERGDTIGFASGISVIVSQGRVTRITRDEDAAIPRDGFVINLSGSEQQMARVFRIGISVNYRVSFENSSNKAWNQVVTAVGAGPRLMTNGQISVYPQNEGFTEAKITDNAGTRSAIGVRRDGSILLVTVPAATVYDLANIMFALGCYQAMNLDGGASSGLWYNGETITAPGRALSNCLIFK